MTNVNPLHLHQRGKEITLLDGSKATVLFDLEALAELEESFGSLGHWQDALNLIQKEQMHAKFAKPLISMLRAGLIHDPTKVNAKFDPALLQDYFVAVMGAAEQAFPQQAHGDENKAVDRPMIETNTVDSRGPISTTSVPSPSSELTSNSGG